MRDTQDCARVADLVRPAFAISRMTAAHRTGPLAHAIRRERAGIRGEGAFKFADRRKTAIIMHRSFNVNCIIMSCASMPARGAAAG
ncbi:hypothetical protein QZM52_20675 [Burkholderia metallica]|uniref:Uncharacterized protein n=1 Tax=Burkholderia metallica TaxID=488729 RepID=A0ABT8PF01_9BURK|nr:hypothetical protein [Burkholderia metallica]MDN7933704.1 hypothetical protein [Burkholderia metallica]